MFLIVIIYLYHAYKYRSLTEGLWSFEFYIAVLYIFSVWATYDFSVWFQIRAELLMLGISTEDYYG